MSEFFTWLGDKFSNVLDFFLSGLYDGFVYIINQIPVPDFLLNLPTYQLPPSVSFFIAPLELNYGLLVIIGAYSARFILRRIPGIG